MCINSCFSQKKLTSDVYQAYPLYHFVDALDTEFEKRKDYNKVAGVAVGVKKIKYLLSSLSRELPLPEHSVLRHSLFVLCNSVAITDDFSARNLNFLKKKACALQELVHKYVSSEDKIATNRWLQNVIHITQLLDNLIVNDNVALILSAYKSYRWNTIHRWRVLKTVGVASVMVSVLGIAGWSAWKYWLRKDTSNHSSKDNKHKKPLSKISTLLDKLEHQEKHILCKVLLESCGAKNAANVALLPLKNFDKKTRKEYIISLLLNLLTLHDFQKPENFFEKKERVELFVRISGRLILLLDSFDQTTRDQFSSEVIRAILGEKRFQEFQQLCKEQQKKQKETQQQHEENEKTKSDSKDNTSKKTLEKKTDVAEDNILLK